MFSWQKLLKMSHCSSPKDTEQDIVSIYFSLVYDTPTGRHSTVGLNGEDKDWEFLWSITTHFFRLEQYTSRIIFRRMCTSFHYDYLPLSLESSH